MRPLALLLLVMLLLALSGAVAASAAPSGAGATTAQEVITTTGLPGEEPAGTSPWVLVLIGAGAGAVVGVFTGLARRRRAEKGRKKPG
ncbi:MAG TPA: hypothetical protein VLS92_10560 [Acidimicrobiia bacterium]|nr:hypothetical protein [Acidimicrobiia bacterium]